DLTKEEARVKLHEWYQRVAESNLREIKAARDAIKYKEEEVLNYFNNRSTNASAESLNSKMKAFRSCLKGIRDISFFFYRCVTVFG
ncbi:MAG: transposase, partial [Prevotella sp.]|nr:transposase [Prevotella sp.]